MENKYLWVFEFFGGMAPSFPLFWSDKNMGCCTIDELDDETRAKVEHMFENNEDTFTPDDGIIQCWSHLNLVPDESSLSVMS